MARNGVRKLLAEPVKTVFDMFTSELPASYFDGVFEHRRDELPRDVEV